MEEGTQNPMAVKIKAENFICPSCGSVLKFDGKKNKFMCVSCGYEGTVEAASENVREFSFDEYNAREQESVPFEGIAVAECPNCGAEITFTETQTATTCPMCGSTQIAEVKQRAGIPPEGVIPFLIDRQEADRLFKEWVTHLWFAPNLLKRSYQAGNLSGQYVPFWTFDADVLCPYEGRGGIRRTEKDKDGKSHTVIDWYPTSGVVSNHFDDIQICAAREGTAELAGDLLPYDTIHQLKPYSPAYLSGYRAELYTVKADEGFEKSKQIMEPKMTELADRDIRNRFDRAEVDEIHPKYTQVTYKHVLLPMWYAPFGYKGKTYQYAINGETGKVTGDRPYSPPKIIAAILATLLALFIGGKIFLSDDTDEAVAAPEPTVTVEPAVAPTADFFATHQIQFA